MIEKARSVLTNTDDLSLLQGTPPQVIWIKSGNSNKTAITQLLLSNQARIRSLLLEENLACVELF